MAATTSASWPSTDTHEPDIKNSRLHNTNTPGPWRFVENDWIGRTVAIGANVRLAITEPCPRCVMITLPQGDLPRDSGILRTAAS